jgi:predicted metal-dependent peptidase
MELKNVLRQVDKAKFELMMVDKGTTFFTALLAGIKLIYNDDHPYAATDGISFWLNPDFIDILSRDEIVGLLLHELGHIIYEHCIICFEGNLDPETHNIAGDHYINLWLLGMGYTLPHVPEHYADKKYLRWSTMKIYLDLMANPKQKPKNYRMDIVKPPKGMSKQEHTLKISNNILKAVMQAELSNDIGSIPGEVLLQVEKMRSPELPWHLILANYMDVYAQDDYSWSRPNKRFLPDFYLPVSRSLHMGQLTVGMDVSGSTTGKVLSVQHAEVTYFWDTLKPLAMRFMTFDTKVHLNEMYHEGSFLDIPELKGGGGTNVVPLLKSIQEEQPRLALIFTDGFFSMPDMSNIDSDIIWIISGNPDFDPPQGKVIHFNGER